MEIFYIDSDTFLNNINISSLDNFLEEKSFKSDKQKIQFCLGRFLVKYIGVLKYTNPKDPKKRKTNQKP